MWTKHGAADSHRPEHGRGEVSAARRRAPIAARLSLAGMCWWLGLVLIGLGMVALVVLGGVGALLCRAKLTRPAGRSMVLLVGLMLPVLACAVMVPPV